MRRVECPDCGKRLTVKKNGRTRVHGPSIRPCLGSDQLVPEEAS